MPELATLLTSPPPLAGVELTQATLHHAVWSEVAPEFSPGEFRNPERMSAEFLRLLHRVRLLAGVPFRFVSDARLGTAGVSNSAHDEFPCCCVDLRVQSSRERSRIVRAACMLGIVRIGIYPPTPGQRAQWGINSGTVHLDASPKLPQDVIWVDY